MTYFMAYLQNILLRVVSNKNKYVINGGLPYIPDRQGEEIRTKKSWPRSFVASISTQGGLPR